MKNRQQSAPDYITDADGQQLVHVALANSNQRATLYAEDYQRLLDVGYSPSWSLNDNGRGYSYVKANGMREDGRRAKLRIARLIARATHGEHVRFVDNNSLNMRGDNLRLQKGRARYNHDDLLPNASAIEAMRQQDGRSEKNRPNLSGCWPGVPSTPIMSYAPNSDRSGTSGPTTPATPAPAYTLR